MAKKKPEQSKPKKLTYAAIARYFGVSARTAGDWIQTKGCPTTSIQDVVAWRAANIRADKNHNGRPPDPSDPESKDRQLTLTEKRLLADTEKIEAEVRWKNLRYQEKAQNLVQRSVVLREVAELVVRVKERILAAPDEFETRFPLEVRAQCKADFEEFVRLLLWELSQWEILGDPMDDVIISAAEAIKARRQRDAMVAVAAPPKPTEEPSDGDSQLRPA